MLKIVLFHLYVTAGMCLPCGLVIWVEIMVILIVMRTNSTMKVFLKFWSLSNCPTNLSATDIQPICDSYRYHPPDQRTRGSPTYSRGSRSRIDSDSSRSPSPVADNLEFITNLGDEEDADAESFTAQRNESNLPPHLRLGAASRESNLPPHLRLGGTSSAASW